MQSEEGKPWGLWGGQSVFSQELTELGRLLEEGRFGVAVEA